MLSSGRVNLFGQMAVIWSCPPTLENSIGMTTPNKYWSYIFGQYKVQTSPSYQLTATLVRFKNVQACWFFEFKSFWWEPWKICLCGLEAFESVPYSCVWKMCYHLWQTLYWVKNFVFGLIRWALKNNLSSYHFSMPREPVVILHIALTNSISTNIQSIVQHPTLSDKQQFSQLQDHLQERTDMFNSAIFYSITSTQPGLQGGRIGYLLCWACLHRHM